MTPQDHSRDLSKIPVRGHHDDQSGGLGRDECASSGWSDTETGGDYALSESSVPRSHDEIGQSGCECAGQMDSVGTAESMRVGQLASSALDRGGKLHWLGCRPERLPILSSGPERTSIDSVIAGGRCESGPNLWVREAARYGSVAPVPQGSSDVAAFFLDNEFHERT